MLPNAHAREVGSLAMTQGSSGASLLVSGELITHVAHGAQFTDLTQEGSLAMTQGSSGAPLPASGETFVHSSQSLNHSPHLFMSLYKIEEGGVAVALSSLFVLCLTHMHVRWAALP